MLLFLGIFVFAQKNYDNKCSKTELTLEGKTLKGYTTNFEFDRESVRRGWWEYARAFGTLLNMKSYYKVTIPATANDGNVDLEIFSQTAPGNNGVTFFVGLEESKYNDQAKDLLLDFKKNFYIGDLVSLIQKKEAQAKSLSNTYNSSVLDEEREELLEKISQLQSEIEELKEEIKKIERK